MFSRRPGHRFNRGRVPAVAAAAGVAELIETLTLAPDAFGDSAANTSVLRHDILTDPTTGIQEVAYHADNLPSVLSGKLALVRIDPDDTVTVDKSATTTNAQDSHNFFAWGVDGDGRMLLSGDLHGDPMNFQHLASGDINFTGWMTPPIEPGATDEGSATYPMQSPPLFLANGDSLILFRDGASGDGKLVLKRWIRSADQFVLVGVIVDEPTWSFYPDLPFWDAENQEIDGAGCWRNTPDINTNHDKIFFRLKTDDNWATVRAERADGSAQTLPITAANAETIATIPVNNGLTNVGCVKRDAAGNPQTFSFMDPGDRITQLFAIRYNGTAWEDPQWVPDDKQLQSAVAFSYVDVTTGVYRPISSPRVVPARSDRTIILMRSDTQGLGVWALICERADLTQWTWKQLDSNDVGDGWFGSVDEYRWASMGEVHSTVQKAQIKLNLGDPDIGPQTLKRLRFRPKSAPYEYVAPTPLWDPDTLAGCVVYTAPRVGGVHATGGPTLANAARVTALVDARDQSAFVVQAATADAPLYIWDHYGSRKGAIQYVAANLDFTQGNDAAVLAAFNGVNTPTVFIYVVEFTTVATAQRVVAFGDTAGANLKYMAAGITAAGLPTFERRVGGVSVAQYTGDGTTPIVAGTRYVVANVFGGSTGYVLVNNVQQGPAISMAFVTAATWTHYNTGRRNRSGTGDLYLNGYHSDIWLGNQAVTLADVQSACSAIAAQNGITF